MLAELARMKYGILVAGAHGKTTTTSLIATVIASSGLSPYSCYRRKTQGYRKQCKIGAGRFPCGRG